jgi:hypothetical protein
MTEMLARVLRMRGRIGLAIVAAILLTSPALAQQEAAQGHAEADTGVLLGFRHINSLADLPPESQLVASFKVAAPYDDHSGRPVQIWERELWSTLQRQPLTQATSQISPKYGLSAPQMRELAIIWMQAHMIVGRLRSDSPALIELRNKALAFVSISGRNPLALGAAAAVLNDLHECAVEDFDRLLEGSADRKTEGWLIAVATQCDAHFAHLPRQSLRLPGQAQSTC